MLIFCFNQSDRIPETNHHPKAIALPKTHHHTKTIAPQKPTITQRR
ncbi:hypothetical protein [Calothrix sp. PCC 6303]|nr:hypothetical protein [Calothrix sp. PCC 6303]